MSAIYLIYLLWGYAAPLCIIYPAPTPTTPLSCGPRLAAYAISAPPSSPFNAPTPHPTPHTTHHTPHCIFLLPAAGSHISNLPNNKSLLQGPRPLELHRDRGGREERRRGRGRRLQRHQLQSRRSRGLRRRSHRRWRRGLLGAVLLRRGSGGFRWRRLRWGLRQGQRRHLDAVLLTRAPSG